jgi:hypothetical protein
MGLKGISASDEALLGASCCGGWKPATTKKTKGKRFLEDREEEAFKRVKPKRKKKKRKKKTPLEVPETS